MVKHHLALVLACLTIVGCSGFKEFEHRKHQKDRAKDAWKAAGPTGAGADYKDGWQTGYYDLSMGSDGQVPPVPPKKYWHAKYQTPDGQQCITDWYAGYQDGVIAAEQVGEFEWQLIPSSGVAALPHYTVTDYPTYYGGTPASEQELPVPHPADRPATSERRQLPHAPQQLSDDAVAATPQAPLDLRTLTGRPSAPVDANQLVHRAIPAPPAPRRVFERVPQPSREAPLTTHVRESEQPSVPPVQANEPTPAVSAERYVASQPEHVELQRSENSLVPLQVQDRQLRGPEAAIVEHPRPSSAPLDRELPARTSVGPLTTPAPKVILVQPFANPNATGSISESRPLLITQSASDQFLAGEPIGEKSPNVKIVPADSQLRREPVASRHSAAASVVTPPVPTTIPDVDELSHSFNASVTAPRRETIAEPTVEIIRTVPEPTYFSVLPLDGNRTTRRESLLPRDVASLPTSKSAEVINIPMLRPTERAPTDFSNAAKTEATLQRGDARIAESKAAEDVRLKDIVSVPRRSAATTTAPTTPPRRPIVLAAQPMQIPAHLAMSPTPARSDVAPQAEGSGSADSHANDMVDVARQAKENVAPTSKPIIVAAQPIRVPANKAAADSHANDMVDVARPARENAAQPAAPTSNPIVVAAQPTRVPAYLAESRRSAATAALPNSKPVASTANAVPKDVAARSSSATAASAGRANKAPEPSASPRTGVSASVVKMVEPVPLESGNAQAKPIVEVARPLKMFEASATRRRYSSTQSPQ